MRVHECMSRDVRGCSSRDTLADAARKLWDHDLGCLPVLDDRGHAAGMLTDRDICMAAYTSGRGLHELSVDQVMSADVARVAGSASLEDAEKIMRERAVRRLPVVDDNDCVIGIISSNDLCRWVDDGGSNGSRHHHATHLVGTLAAIGKPRVKAARPEPLMSTALATAAPKANRLRGPSTAEGVGVRVTGK